MRRALLALLAVSLPLAGCFSDAADPVEPVAATNGTVIIDEARPDPTFNDIPEADLGYVAQPDLNATLDAPPRLVAGEWWRIHLTSPLTGADVQFVRVVAKVEDDLYVMGMPHEGWYKEAVIYHSPAFGDVDKDLSHRAHNIPFVPLKFPLADGATWETNFENEATLVATVAVESPTEARVTFRAPNAQADAPPAIELVYDAAMHEVTYFKNVYMVWEVVEHGYGFEGWVTVPRGEELVFFHARLGGGIGLTQAGIAPAPPTDTVLLNKGFNRVSFIMQVGDVIGLPTGAPGAYRITATAPDGTPYTTEQVPSTGGYVLQFFEHRDPDGEWLIDHVAAGPGGTFIEGIAYHQYDIQLPGGAIRSDHSHEVVR